jgi:hypothetical protein
MTPIPPAGKSVITACSHLHADLTASLQVGHIELHLISVIQWLVDLAKKGLLIHRINHCHCLLDRPAFSGGGVVQAAAAAAAEAAAVFNVLSFVLGRLTLPQ